jgi:polygalacturonase
MVRAGWAVLVLILSTITAAQLARAADTAPASFSVRSFGAVGDGKTKDTTAFQKALDTCAVSGGGEVIVPAGTYLIGSVQIGFHTTLRLEKDAVIRGSGDLNDYPMMDIRWEGRWQSGHRALIYAGDVDHVGIVGPGRIEGNATAAQPQYCSNVTIKDLTIRSGRDGIDVDSCKGVTIDNCDIESGDDCISLKSGRGLDGARIGRPTEDVTITNCKLHGTYFSCLGIGSETSAGVRGVRMSHCTLSCRTFCIYLKSRLGRAGMDEDISGDDLDVLGGGFLKINLIGAGNLNTNDDPVEGPLGIPTARNLRFTNVRLTNAAKVAEATEVARDKPIDGLELSNITGTAAKGITLRYIQNAKLADINVTGVGGAMLATDAVTGTGLESAVKYVPPPPSTSPASRRGGRRRGPATAPVSAPAE